MVVYIAGYLHLVRQPIPPPYQVDPATVAYTLGYLAGSHTVSGAKKGAVRAYVGLHKLV